MSSLFFLLALMFFYFIFFDFRNPISLFRFLGVVFSICMIFMFNLNWIFNHPVKLSYFSLLIFLIVAAGLYFKRKSNLLEKFKFDLKSLKMWGFLFVSAIFLIFISNLYFEGKWNEPRYTTPDSGGHYLYIARTAESGMMPLFMSNVIYEASGYNEVFLHHHDTYFPGGSAIFFIMDKILNIDKVTLLQIFNVLFFISVSLYLFLILHQRKIFKSIYFWIIILGFIFFGNLFNLVSTSYTNQLFGLFFLLLSIDLFEYFKETGKWGFLPVAIGGLIISYFYWLPVLILFITFSFFDFAKLYRTKLSIKENKQAYIVLLVFCAALFLNIGYIIKILQTNQTGMITEGSFTFSSNFFDDTKIILPFALFNMFLFLKRRINGKGNYFLANFIFSILGYSCILLILFYMKKASGYALGKSFFLATPMIWIVGMEFFEKSIDKLKKENIDYFFDKIKRYLIDAKNYTAQIFGVVFILAITIVIFREAGLGFPMEKIEFFPAASNNLNTIFINKNKRVDISSDQLKFIDEIKNNYNGLLDDNRLLIIAPSDMAMWVFAYSGIWTRPYSMMPPGAENKGIYSPMSFYSREIADYRQWLFNDKDHYIALLNCGEAEGWAKKFGFNENDYENIYSDNYGNELLKLKSGVSTRFIYSEELDIRRDYAGKGWDGDKNKIIKISPIPISSEIVSRYSNLSGLFFNISISGKEKKSLNSDYLFKLKNGKCEENGSSVFEKIISKEDVKNIPAGQPIKIFFDNPIADSANKSFCFDFSRVKKLNNEEKETLSLILKDNIADHAEIYNYINK